jgi:carbonic anhydrase/acetyltransferase-like protein (isoleucine patch superfamily)
LAAPEQRRRLWRLRSGRWRCIGGKCMNSSAQERSGPGRPKIDPSAFVAANAVIAGDVTVGPEAVISYGAVLTADGGAIVIGRNTIVMENTVIRSSEHHHCRIGANVMVGPLCHLSGCTIEDEVFIATGASVFNGARLGKHSEVRVGGVVHVNTFVPVETTVPIGWVAVGDPAQIFPPEQHDAIWAVQRGLNFPKTVFGVDRDAPASESLIKQMTNRYSRFLLRFRRR